MSNIRLTLCHYSDFLCNTWLFNLICCTYINFPENPDHYISYMLYERLHGEEQFCSKKYLLEMAPSHAKMHLKVHQKN